MSNYTQLERDPEPYGIQVKSLAVLKNRKREWEVAADHKKSLVQNAGSDHRATMSMYFANSFGRGSTTAWKCRNCVKVNR